MSCRPLNNFIHNEASTSTSELCFMTEYKIPQSGALIPQDFRANTKDMKPTMYSDGRGPVKISTTHGKLHPQHEPTGTTEVLTFYPTIEEFRDFSGYIKSIEKTGAHLKCGIAKIVPPEGWHPRPSRKNNYSDIDDFEINNPVKETIEGLSGVFYKTNRVFRKKMTVKEFRKMANSTAYKNPKPELSGIDLENEYFKNILNREPIYGADTEGSIYDPNVVEFNMNHLNTILDETKSETRISGVNTVYLYFGMYKTTFPWHSEDMDLYSINYLHFGAPKYWFAISSESADRFERLMTQQFSGQDNLCKAFLRHKCYIISPSLLRAHNIPYGTMVQRPNEFIITFPKGYHMGFNTGYNLAESTNFASDRWIDYGKNAILCKCTKDTVEIDMRPYMKKYRPEEFDQWYNYWYGDRVSYDDDGKNKKGKRTGTSKRKMEIGTIGTAKVGKFNIGSSITEFKSSWSPFKGIEKMDPLLSADINSDIYDTATATDFNTDCEDLKKKFKKNTKEILSTGTNLFAERQLNQVTAKYWPHCDVCSYFQPLHMRPRCSEVPKISKRLIYPWCLAKQELKMEGTLKEESDRLITCDNCYITVHSACYSGEIPNETGWLCFRCRNQSDIKIRSSSCSLCELRGGALFPCQLGTDKTFVHAICAIMNRRTTFDRFRGPRACSVIPPPRQNAPTYSSQPLGYEYQFEFGTMYEKSRWECQVCQKSREGLIACVLCIENPNSITLPTTVHATCGRQAGYLFEIRHYPKNFVMICDKHNDYLEDKSFNYVNIKCGDEVYASFDGDELEKGLVELITNKETIVVDFHDGSVSRDLQPCDIMQCECLSCNRKQHQIGARVKVKWDDGLIYDGYNRGVGVLTEYKIRFQNGTYKNFTRQKILSKREMLMASKKS